MLVARVHVHVGAVGEFLAGAADDLLKMGLRLVELVFLHRAQTGLVVLDGLRDLGSSAMDFFAVGF